MITRAVLFERFAGRDEELRYLLELQRRAAEEIRGGTVSISGEAGVGKSRLLTEFARALATDNRVSILRIRCGELPIAYAPFVDILEELATLRGVARAEPALEAVSNALALLTTADEAHAFDAVERKRQLFDKVVGAIGLAAKRLGQLTIAIEDVHWSDISSLEALRALVRAVPELPLVVLFTYRMEDLVADPPRALAVAAIERENCDRVTLGPLAYGDIAALLRRPIPDAGNDVLRRIYALSEGRPYVAEELARSVVEHGSDIDFANALTLRSAVLERVSQLSPADRSVVDRAAVLGRNFAPDDLRALGASRDRLFAALRAALALQLFEEIDVGGEPWFRFRHALTREILYRSLLAIERRALHLEIAAHLEAAGGRTAELAYHLSAAGDGKRAAAANERAGDEAASVAGFADASKLFSRSLDFATDSESIARVGLKLAECLEAVGDLDELLATGTGLAEKLVAAGRPDDALAITIVAIGAVAPSRLADASTLLERAKLLVGPATNPNVRFDFELASAAVLRLQLLNHESLEACARAEAAVKTLSSKQRNALLLSQSTAYMRLNDLARAQEFLERRRREGPGSDERDEAQTSEAMSRVSYRRGELRPAIDHCLDAAARWQRIGRERAAFLQRSNAALAASDYGDFAFVQSIVERAHRDGSEPSEALEAARIRWVRAVGGDAASLLTKFDSVVETGTLYMTFMLGRDLPFIFQEDPALARSIAVRALDRIPVGDVDSEIAEAIALFGSDDELERALGALDKNSHRENDLWFSTGNAIVAARVARRRHRHLEAAEHARVAVELATKMQHWLYLSNAFSLAGDDARARAVLVRVGAHAELARFDRGRQAVRDSAGEAAVRLTQRERQITSYLCAGLSSREIADRLSIGLRTVETHVSNAYAKLGVGSRAELVEVLAEEKPAP